MSDISDKVVQLSEIIIIIILNERNVGHLQRLGTKLTVASTVSVNPNLEVIIFIKSGIRVPKVIEKSWSNLKCLLITKS